MTVQRAILIAGPTASGKSGLALCLARRLGGVVINADSMQVYRDLRILTARPTAAEEAEIPHALYGIVPAREAYSAGRFAIDAEAAIRSAESAGRRPIIVGGTGLYFQALLRGLSPVPPIPEEIRAQWRAAAETTTAPMLHAELAARDPAMAARLAPADRQRIIRALEVIEATGRSLADWQAVPGRPVLEETSTIRLWLDIDRPALHARIAARLDSMLAAGAIDELQALLSQGLPEDLPVMRAVGVPELTRTIREKIPLADAMEAARTATRQYAKRQRTWARRNMITWKQISQQEMTRIISSKEILIDA